MNTTTPPPPRPGPRPIARTALLRRRTDLAQTLLEFRFHPDHGYSIDERDTLKTTCAALIGPLCGTPHGRPVSIDDSRLVHRVLGHAETKPGTGPGWLDDLIGRVVTAQDTGRPMAPAPTPTPAGPERTDPVHDTAMDALLLADHVDSVARYHLTRAAVVLVTRLCGDRDLAAMIVDRAQYMLRHGTTDDDWLDDAVTFVSGRDTDDDADDAPAPVDGEATLDWVSAGTSEAGDQHAASRWALASSASARYDVGPMFATPGPDGQRWAAALVQLDDDGTETGRVELGHYGDEETAKERALAYERTGR